MIKSLFSSRSAINKPTQDKQAFVSPPEGSSSSFDYEDTNFMVNDQASVRVCNNCGETKKVSDFPMSSLVVVGKKSRQCRFCYQLKNRGLDVSGMSCDGDLPMRSVDFNKRGSSPTNHCRKENKNSKTARGRRRRRVPVASFPTTSIPVESRESGFEMVSTTSEFV